MTTESLSTPRSWGTTALLRAVGATAVAGLVTAGVAAVVGGSDAAWGALVGTALVVAVFGFGTFTVNAVAALLPAASLLVAVLTYTLQVVAMALVFVALSNSGLLDGTIDRNWLGGTVIGGTLVWLVVQVMLSTSRRIPIYDLPERDTVEVVPTGVEAGER